MYMGGGILGTTLIVPVVIFPVAQVSLLGKR
jgi:hypothetical protein